MKRLACVLWTLLALQHFVTLASGEDSLEYILRTIDYLISVKPGVFSVVFYDAAGPDDSRDGIFHEIVQSPRLDHVVKYVFDGPYQKHYHKVLRDPSLVVINAGNDLTHFKQRNTTSSLYDMLSLFDPWTKLLVFADQSTLFSVEEIIYWANYTYSAFFDSATQQFRLCNGVSCWIYQSEFLEPMFVFEVIRRWRAGRNISYTGRGCFGFDWNIHWLKETARYLYTDVVEIEHNCTNKETGVMLENCLDELEVKQGMIDVKFFNVWMILDILLDIIFDEVICTNNPFFIKIAVPRDRPLNTAELLLMPFSWHVWTLLLMILVSSEFIKYHWPEHFNNDPILLIVCGFERRNLHQAGRLEKMCFLSLIVLLFFVSNAYESKLLSFMTSKPAIQRIKTLEDLLKSDVKFLAELEQNPLLEEQSILGEKMVQGDLPVLSETVPGVGVIFFTEFCDMLGEMAFDYERNQPFYVVLDTAYYDSPECYGTSPRFILQKTFHSMHGWLVEAGLMKQWKQQWVSKMRSEHIGRRYREDTRYKVDLSFEDIEPAWLALVVGLCLSLVTFLAELSVKWVDH